MAILVQIQKTKIFNTKRALAAVVLAGATIFFTGAPLMASQPAASSGYLSLPTVIKVPLGSNVLYNTSGLPLYRFQVTAESSGDIGLYKTTFKIQTTSATLSNFELVEEPGTPYEVTVSSVPVRLRPNSVYELNMLLNSLSTYRQVWAGTTKTYELRATVANAKTGSSVTLSLQGDTVAPAISPNTAAGIDESAYDNFIWTDFNLGNKTWTATKSPQWYNGYPVTSLGAGLATEALIK